MRPNTCVADRRIPRLRSGFAAERQNVVRTSESRHNGAEMSEKLTTEALMKALKAFNENDLETAATLVHPDVTYIVRGRAAISGVHHGVEGFRAALQRVRELTAGTMTATPEVVLAEGDDIMMYMRVTGTRPDGREYDSHHAYLYRFREGKLIEGQTIPVDQAAFEGFLAD